VGGEKVKEYLEMETTSSGRDDSIICTLGELEDSQSGLFRSEGHIEKSAALAIQTHASTLGQGSVVSQVEHTFIIDNITDQEEEMLFNPEDLRRAETGLYGCHAFSTVSKLQGIYEGFAEIPKTKTEHEDVTQQCGGQSFVPQLRLQYGAEAVSQLQTTELYGSNSDANLQQFPAVSTTTYCEDGGKYQLASSWRKERVSKATTSKSIRQQRMSPSQFVQHRVSPTSSTGE
jgi:hypothetical protein